MGQTFGVEVRTTRHSSWTQCRQRGGALAPGYLVMLDLAGSDALTSADADEGAKQNPGSRTAASSPFATVIPATAGLTHGRVGVVMDRTALDDGLGLYELGEDGSGGISPVIVPRALVLVDAASVAGAALQVQTGSTFAPSGGGATFAILLDDCTSDDGRGPSATLNYKRVILYSAGVASYAVAGVLPAGSVSTTELADGSVTNVKLGANAVTTDKIAADAVQRSDIHDAAGMTFPRTAALFLPGIAGSRQRCSFSFDPTNTTDLTIRFKRRGLSRPATGALYQIGGLLSADRPVIAYVNTAGAYTFEARENTTVRASHTWTDDLEEHIWEIAWTSAGCVISLDGTVVVTPGTAASFLDTSFVFAIGAAATSATSFVGDHAIYRDFEVIDPATATNKVYLRLDEPAGGPYRNAYLTPGDPLYDATNTSGVTIATTGTATQYPSAVEVQTVNGGDRPVASRRLLERTRVAAYSGLGDHATAGEFASVNWAPTGTPAFNVEFNCARSLTQGGDVMIWGRIAADYANINVTAAGVVQARVNTTNICTTTVAALPPDGCVRHVRVEFRDSGADVTAAIYVGRILLASGTLAATQFSAAAASHRIGATSVSRRWSGLIFDVLLEDLNSQTNSGFYLMDEARGSTTYANSYSGGTLAALTKNGFVSSCPVASSDGRGRSWQPSDGRPHLIGAYAAAGQAGITGAVNITNDTELTDSQGFFATSAFTTPAAGFVTATQCGTISGDAALASVVTVGIAIGTTVQGTGLPVGVPALSTGVPYSVRAAFPVAAGDVVQGRISAVSAGTVAHESSYFTLEYYETPAAG